MDLGIQGKRALIIGATHNIAQAIAVDLAREGVLVALVSDNRKKTSTILRAIGGKGQGHCTIYSDLTREGQAPALIRKVTKVFGPVDIVVNCLDNSVQRDDPYCSTSGWKKVFRQNFEVAIEVNNCFIPSMKQRGWGRIVNLSSGASMEHAADIQYCTSKAALTAYTRCMGRILALETANVVMSAVLPGAVLKQDRPHSGRLPAAQEISPMVVMLCSALATYCQGAIVPIDGGQARHYFRLGRS